MSRITFQIFWVECLGACSPFGQGYLPSLILRDSLQKKSPIPIPISNQFRINIPILATLTDLAYGVWGSKATDSYFQGKSFGKLPIAFTDLKLVGINEVTIFEQCISKSMGPKTRFFSPTQNEFKKKCCNLIQSTSDKEGWSLVSPQGVSSFHCNG